MRTTTTARGRTAVVFATMGTALAGVTAVAAPAEAATRVTAFGLQGAAYGTLLSGGDLPVTSGKSAYSSISCTRKAGLRASNHVAEANLGDGAVRVGAVTSSNRTWKNSSGVHVGSKNKIASVVVGDYDGTYGALKIESLMTNAHAWHDARGYHARTKTTGVLVVTAGIQPIETNIAQLPAVQVPGQEYTVPLPKSGEYLSVPGVARLTSDWTRNVERPSFANASVNGLRVHLEATKSLVIVGRAGARITGEVTTGVMSGKAFGSKLDMAGGIVSSGKTAVKTLPCPGTGGVWKATSTLGSSVPGVLSVDATRSEVYGKQNANRSGAARTRSTVARVSLADDSIVLEAIKAQANVIKRRTGILKKNSRGTSPGTITVDGHTTTLPVRGTVHLPNDLGTIETGIVARGRYGIKVTAVKVTLSNTTAADSVLLFGNAWATIRPS